LLLSLLHQLVSISTTEGVSTEEEQHQHQHQQEESEHNPPTNQIRPMTTIQSNNNNKNNKEEEDKFIIEPSPFGIMMNELLQEEIQDIWNSHNVQ